MRISFFIIHGMLKEHGFHKTFQGLTMAQVNLASCYEEGLGVAKDINQAKFWFEKAANSNKNAEKLQTINHSEKWSQSSHQIKLADISYQYYLAVYNLFVPGIKNRTVGMMYLNLAA